VAKSIRQYFFDIYLKQTQTEEERNKGVEKILPFIKILKNPIIQGKWIQKISSELNISDIFLYEALSRIQAKEPDREFLSSKKENFLKEQKERIFAILFVFPALFKNHKEEIKKIFKNDSLYTTWLKFYNQKKRNKDKFLAKLKNPSLPLAVLEVENIFSKEEKMLAEKELVDLLDFFKKEMKKKKIKALQEKIKIYEQKKDTKKLKTLLKKLQDIIIS